MRSEARKTVWRKKELNFKPNQVHVKEAETSEVILDEPNPNENPKTVSSPKVVASSKPVDLLEPVEPVEKPKILKQPELGVKCDSVPEEKKPYPKMSLEWTNPMCENLGKRGKRPYHILVKPNKHLCGGISVGDNHQTFAGMHRPECWVSKDPCHD